VQKKNGGYSVLVRGGSGKRPVRPSGEHVPDSARMAEGRKRPPEGMARGGRDGPGNRTGRRDGARKKKAGSSRPVTVAVGATDYRNYEIVSGLNAGDTVVYVPPVTDAENQNQQRGPGGPRR